MQFILNQKGEEIISVTEKAHINIAKTGDSYAIYCRNGRIGERGEISFVLGYFQKIENARYVLQQLFDAISNDCSYEMPKEYDLPDLRILQGHGVATSRRLSHGRS